MDSKGRFTIIQWGEQGLTVSPVQVYHNELQRAGLNDFIMFKEKNKFPNQLKAFLSKLIDFKMFHTKNAGQTPRRKNRKWKVPALGYIAKNNKCAVNVGSYLEFLAQQNQICVIIVKRNKIIWSCKIYFLYFNLKC